MVLRILQMCIIVILVSASRGRVRPETNEHSEFGHPRFQPINFETLPHDRVSGPHSRAKSSDRRISGVSIKNPQQSNDGLVGSLRDLLIIVDSSGSIGRTNFNNAMDQLARLMGLYCPSPDPFRRFHQAALIQYSSTVKEIFDFNDKPNTLAVQQGIRNMSYMGSSTCTATAFNYAYDSMFTTAKGMRTRADVKQEVLLITDGLSNCGGDAIKAAKRLRRKADITVLAVGTYSSKDLKELKQYASLPVDQHFSILKNYSELKNLVNLYVQQLKLMDPFPMIKPTTTQTAEVLVPSALFQPIINKSRDLLLIVDSSTDIGQTNFDKTKTKLARLIGMLCPTPDPFRRNYHQAALIEYSTTVKEIFDFNDKPNTLAVQQGIRSMSFMNSSRCTATALNYAYDIMFTTAKGMRTRPDVKQEVLLLTHGLSNCGGDVMKAAKRLQQKAHIYVLAVGIQSHLQMAELITLASAPANEHIFAVNNYRDLSNLLAQLESTITTMPCVPFDL